MGNVIELIAKYGDKLEPIGRVGLAVLRLIIRVAEPRGKDDGTIETPEEVDARIVALLASADASLGRVEERAKAEIAAAGGAVGNVAGKVLALVLAVALSACSWAIPASGPATPSEPGGGTGGPVIVDPAPGVAVLTVHVEPAAAVVTVREDLAGVAGSAGGPFSVSRSWPTRADGTIVEEFRTGSRLTVTASAPGYVTSAPTEVLAVAGAVQAVRIRLARVPAVTTPEPVDQIPAAVWVTIRRFVAAYPWPMGDGSEAYIQSLREWTRRLAEQIRHDHGPEWGHKATSAGAPPSKESIARKIGPDLHVWDMLTGAATGSPTLPGRPSHYHVNDQFFIVVEPVNHLAAVAPPAARAEIPRPWIGVTAFDLGVRLEAGDRRWVDMMVAEGFTVARVVVSSVYRTPRTLADGLRQLPITLSTLAGAGLRAEVVVLVDTRDYRMGRAEMRDYLRAVVAICERYPGAVAGIEIANESTHGTQVADLSDLAFLRELSDLVPVAFPVSWGSSHGGEAVFVAGGSYVTHHSDRDLSPEENAAIMAAAQRASGQWVIDDEALGIAEVRRPGARTDDPAYGERQARAARAHGLGGVTLHLDAGLTANVDLLGPIQREAIRRFVAAMR